MKYCIVFYLFFNVNLIEANDWIKVKSINSDKKHIQLIEFNKNNVDLDIKLSSEGETISIQNNVLKRDTIEYLVIKPSLTSIKYDLFIRPTVENDFNPKANVDIRKILNEELKYYEFMQQLSIDWRVSSKQQQLKIIKNVEDVIKKHFLLDAQRNEISNVYYWMLFHQQKYSKIITLVESNNINDVDDFNLTYQIDWVLGLSYLNSGQFNTASRLFSNILNRLDNDLIDPLKLNKLEIQSSKGLSNALSSYHSNREQVDGYDDLTEAVINSVRNGDNLLTSKNYYNLASYFFFANNWHESLGALKNAEVYLTKSKSIEIEFQILNQKAIAYSMTNQLAKAQFNYRNALLTFDKESNSYSKSGIYTNLANTYELLGDYSKAIRYHESSLNFYMSNNHRMESAIAKNALGRLYRHLGDFKNSISYHVQSINSYEQLSLTNQINSILELAFDYFDMGEFIRSKKYTMIAAILENNNSPSVGDINSTPILSYFNLSKLSNEELIDRFNELSFKKLETNTEFRLTKQLAKLNLVTNNLKQYSVYENQLKSFASFEKIQIDHQLDYYNLRMDYMIRTKNYHEFINLALNSIELIQSTRMKFDVSYLALYWTDQASFTLDKLINVLYSQGNNTSQIFELLEKYYAVNLREKRHNSTNELVVSKSKKNQQALNNYVNLERESILTENTNNQNLADEAKEHFLALNNIEEKPYKNSKLDYFNLEQVQAKLAKDELLLRYYINDTNAFVFVIDNDNWYLKAIPSESELKKMTKALLETIKSKSFAKLSSFDNELSNIVPLELFKTGKYKKLIIIPDGVLNIMPFGSFNIDSEQGRYTALASKINIERIYSASDYFTTLESNKVINNSQTISIFANPDFLNASDENIREKFDTENKLWEFSPLPYTATEAEYITQIFADSDINLLIGKKATNDNFLAKGNRNANIIHIATHGFFNDRSIENVGIATSIINEKNELSAGILTMREILYQPFQANLAVVSGCETTLGKEISGEGFNSLSRGLLSQGVNSVIGTIWSISDRATPVFMKEFYTNLRDMNGNVSKALNRTKVNFATKSQFRRYRHPYYWAGFVLTSSNKAISENIFQ